MKVLLALNAPAQELVEAAGDSFCGPNPLFYFQLAEALNQRGECLSEALQYADWSVVRIPNDALGPFDVRGLIASIRIKRGEFDWVIRAMSKARQSDSAAFAWLGLAYEKSNFIDEAIESYVQAVGARDVWNSRLRGASGYPGISYLPNFDLEALYRKRYGTLNGLSEKVETARRAARRTIDVDPYRNEPPLSTWIGHDLNSRAVGTHDYKNQIVVLCFYDTEYEPAVQNLKYVQKLRDQYKGRGVVFLLVEVDLTRIPPETRRRNVAEALERTGISVPVVLEDFEGTRRAFHVWGTGGIVIINRDGVEEFQSGGINEENLPRTVKLLDYLLEEGSARPK
ncbi:MAG: redoxin domain-containing protein [bacterium]